MEPYPMLIPAKPYQVHARQADWGRPMHVSHCRYSNACQFLSCQPLLNPLQYRAIRGISWILQTVERWLLRFFDWVDDSLGA